MDNQDEFQIEKNNCANLEELINLSKTYYNEGDIISKDYLTWQYLNNPTGKPFLFVSRETKENELAGQYLVLPIKFIVQSKTIIGTLSLNTLTSPKFQGKGLFTKMAKETYKDCTINNALFTIGFPNPQSYPGFVRKLDFKHLGDIPLLIKPLKYGKIFFSIFNKNRKKHGGSININSADIKNNNISEFIFNNKKLKDKYSEFWDSISKQYTLSTLKDFTFLNWRYNEIPTRKYRLFYLEENNNIKGLIIVKAENVWGFNVGLVMDLLVIDNNKYVGKKLLNFVKQVFKKSNLDFIATLHNRTNEYGLLKSNGFFSVPQKILPQKIHFIVKLNKDFSDSELLFDLNNWKLTFGDYDVF